jgi:hypothetical protein
MKSKPKPIVVVTTPVFADFKDNFLKDYHVIQIEIENVKPKIEVFYEKDFNDVKYEELKSIIENAVKQKTTN